MHLITPYRVFAIGGMAALLLIFATAGHLWMPDANTNPDHVCLPSVSEEDAAWKRLEQELEAAFREFDAVDAPAKAAFKAEEKVVVMDLIKRKEELDARYEAASRLTRQLNPARYSCDKAELHSPALVSACQELAAAADLVRVARKGECRDASPFFHEADVKDGSPCASAAQRYWSTISNARSKYQERTEAAQASYRRTMLPACSLWQRITFKELDRPTLRARQKCVTANLSPTLVVKCTQPELNGK